MDFLQERGYSLVVSRPFRFGVITYQAGSKEEWITKVRRAEQLEYAVLLVPDHFGEQLAAIPALQAAEATTTLRVGSYVFDNDFRHPAMLAKENSLWPLLPKRLSYCKPSPVSTRSLLGEIKGRLGGSSYSLSL